MGNIWKPYLYSSNMDGYDEGGGISFDKDTYYNENVNHAQMKRIVLDGDYTPAISTINPILIADITATGNYISITTPHSNRQVDIYPIRI